MLLVIQAYFINQKGDVLLHIMQSKRILTLFKRTKYTAYGYKYEIKMGLESNLFALKMLLIHMKKC